MSIGPIPWCRIVEYADRTGMTRDEGEQFVKMVQALDQVLVSRRCREAAKSTK